MTALRSLAFNAAFFAWSLLTHVIFLPALLLPRQATNVAGRVWAAGALHMLAWLCNLTYEIRGRGNLPNGPCIVAAKHQSAWDVLIFSEILDDASYVIKRELVFVPLLGWYLAKIGCVPIDRTGGAAALRRMIARARRVLAKGRPLVIYPEGTRTTPGERGAYHPGVAALYTHLSATVVPVALNSGLFWGRRSFLKTPGRITLEILPPIAPGLSRQRFVHELERRIEEASTRLAMEAKVH